MEISIENSKIILKVEFSTILMTLFVLFCTLEVLRIAHIGGLDALPMWIGSLVLGAAVIAGLREHLATNQVVASECGHLFSSEITTVVVSLHVASLVLILSMSLAFLVDFPSFLIVQLALLATLWLDNRRVGVSLNLLRASFLFTVIYVSYVLLLTKNAFMELVTLAYYISWLGLQIMIEQPTKHV